MGISELVERMVAPEGAPAGPVRVQVSMRIPGDTAWWLDRLAGCASMSRSAFAQELVVKGVAQLVEEAAAAGVLVDEDFREFGYWQHEAEEG